MEKQTLLPELLYSLRETQLQTVHALVDICRLAVWSLLLLAGSIALLALQDIFGALIIQIAAGVLLTASLGLFVWALFVLPDSYDDLIPDASEVEQAILRELQRPLGDLEQTGPKLPES
jgi:hypothetical protein